MSLSKTEPTVCAIMLTADRPELARRAVECFRRQTYPGEMRLVAWDTSGPKVPHIQVSEMEKREYYVSSPDRLVIGQLRNRANDYAISLEAFVEPDILIHWDDDDWSHPNRIAEQVSLLQSSGTDCVGYREMLFWRQGYPSIHRPKPLSSIEGAWLYSNPNPGYALGTSLCYWRKTWERKPFAATSQGEDLQFITGLKVCGVSAISRTVPFLGESMPPGEQPMSSRMIARIHGGNTSTAYSPRKMANVPEWKLVPEWSDHCRRVMQ